MFSFLHPKTARKSNTNYDARTDLFNFNLNYFLCLETAHKSTTNYFAHPGPARKKKNYCWIISGISSRPGFG